MHTFVAVSLLPLATTALVLVAPPARRSATAPGRRPWVVARAVSPTKSPFGEATQAHRRAWCAALQMPGHRRRCRTSLAFGAVRRAAGDDGSPEDGAADADAPGADSASPAGDAPATTTSRAKHKDVIAKDQPRDGWVKMTRALRGEYDPTDPAADTEQSPGVLVSALVDEFPTRYRFTAVGQPGGECASPDDFGLALAQIVRDETGHDDVLTRVTPRLDGKYASVTLECVVQSPTMIQRIVDVLKAQDQVKMSF